MSTLAFDTHKFVRDLTKANMPEEQAEVLAQHYANLHSDRLATKDDISGLKKDMMHLEERLDAKIDHLEERLNDRILYTAVKSQMAGVAFICAVIGLMLKYF